MDKLRHGFCLDAHVTGRGLLPVFLGAAQLHLGHRHGGGLEGKEMFFSDLCIAICLYLLLHDFLDLSTLVHFFRFSGTMSSSILHQCAFCGHVSDISPSLAAFVENPHCNQVVTLLPRVRGPAVPDRESSADCPCLKAMTSCKTSWLLCSIDR